MSRKVYAPNREKIFNDIEHGDTCEAMSCPSYRRIGDDHRKQLVCMATDHGDCVRVAQVAQEVNQFIADNDDVFVYVQLVSE